MLISRTDGSLTRWTLPCTIYLTERQVQHGLLHSFTLGYATAPARAESFFAGLESELTDRHSWTTKTEARLAVFTWIEAWHHLHRLHAYSGYLSPAEFEKSLQKQEVFVAEYEYPV